MYLLFKSTNVANALVLCSRLRNSKLQLTKCFSLSRMNSLLEARTLFNIPMSCPIAPLPTRDNVQFQDIQMSAQPSTVALTEAMHWGCCVVNHYKYCLRSADHTYGEMKAE